MNVNEWKILDSMLTGTIPFCGKSINNFFSLDGKSKSLN